MTDVRAQRDANDPGQSHDDTESVGYVTLRDFGAAGFRAAIGLGAQEGEFGSPPHEGTGAKGDTSEGHNTEDEGSIVG